MDKTKFFTEQVTSGGRGGRPDEDIQHGITDFGAAEMPDDSTSKYDALRIVSAAAETVWAVLMVACVLSLLWSMLGPSIPTS